MTPTPTDFQSFVQILIDLGLKAIPLMAVIAFFVFLLGVGKFIRSTGNEKEMESAKKILVWGVVALFVLFTIWGIVTFLKQQFGFGGEVGIPQLPTEYTFSKVVN